MIFVVRVGFVSRCVHARLKFLCAAVTICGTLVNTQTNRQGYRHTDGILSAYMNRVGYGGWIAKWVASSGRV